MIIIGFILNCLWIVSLESFLSTKHSSNLSRSSLMILILILDCRLGISSILLNLFLFSISYLFYFPIVLMSKNIFNCILFSKILLTLLTDLFRNSSINQIKLLYLFLFLYMLLYFFGFSFSNIVIQCIMKNIFL